MGCVSLRSLGRARARKTLRARRGEPNLRAPLHCHIHVSGCVIDLPLKFKVCSASREQVGRNGHHCFWPLGEHCWRCWAKPFAVSAAKVLKLQKKRLRHFQGGSRALAVDCLAGRDSRAQRNSNGHTSGRATRKTPACLCRRRRSAGALKQVPRSYQTTKQSTGSPVALGTGERVCGNNWAPPVWAGRI